MSKYFKNVKSYEDLKNQYRELLKANHPDNGGELEKMQEINAEYDIMFRIWKDKAIKSDSLKEIEKNETAQSTRSSFYTAFGWEGSNHDWSRSLKEIAKIVRAYVKEKYPTYKFSVRTSYASMCQELHVELKESPIEVYKSFDEFTEDDKSQFFRKANHNDYWTLDCWNDEEFKKEYERITSEHGNFFKILNEVTKSVIDDVDNFVKTYNYSDCDGQIDYFHVDFYYFGCAQNNGCDIKIVPKTARIKPATTTPAKSNKSDHASGANEIETNGKPYSVEESKHTKTGEVIYLVKWLDTLSREKYIKLNQQIRDLGGYYSKFTHSFIFKEDPTNLLEGVKIA